MDFISIRVCILDRIVPRVGIQIAIDVIKNASHAGQILVMFLCLLVYWRFGM